MFLKASLCRKGKGYVVGAGDYSHDRFGQEDVHAVRVARSSGPVAPLGFCNRGGGSEVWVYRGSRLRSPPVPVVLSVYQRGSLLDGLAMYLSCDTKKFHDNESTHILHNFGRPPIGGKLSPGGATAQDV